MWWAWAKTSFYFLGCFLLSACTPKQEKPRFFLASSLAPLAADIERLYGKPIDLMFLSSAAIAKHVEQQTPCEAVILADDRFRNYLIEKKLVNQKGLSIAGNSLVLVAKTSARKKNFAQALLEITSDQRIIIGDPEYVPLGAYTKEALEKMQWFFKLKPQMMYAHSAKDARLLLLRGAAHLAILYRTDAENLSIIADIDNSLHRPIEYPFLICNHGAQETARAIEKIIFSTDFQKALRAKGFTVGP